MSHGLHLSNTLQVFRLDQGMVWLMIFAGIVMMANQAGLWLYQPYFERAGIEVFWFGLLFASFQFVSAYAGRHYYLAASRWGEKKILITMLLSSTVASIMLGLWVTPLSILLIYVHQIVRGFYKIIFSEMVNRRVPSAVRASALSVQNLVGRILIALVMPFIGHFADVYSIEQTFVLIGIIGLGCGLPLLLMLRRYGIV